MTDITELTQDSARESGSILIIVAARMTRREFFTPLHALCESGKRVVSTRALCDAVERAEEHMVSQVQKIVDGHDRLTKKLKEAESRNAELVEALEKAQRHANLTEAERQAYLGLISKRDERIAELEQQNSIANEKVTELSRLVQHNISRSEDAERRAERISKSSSLSHPGLLHATNELVLIFSHALADKLYAAQEKYNHGASWRNNDWQEACQRDFQKHIAKGDPRDVAAYCAFMWWHGWSTKPAEGLESSTVTVKLPHQTDFDDPLSAYEAIEKCKEALTAAGIKVEAE